jgi:predicted MFS family arabinose efflux permease
MHVHVLGIQTSEPDHIAPPEWYGGLLAQRAAATPKANGSIRGLEARNTISFLPGAAGIVPAVWSPLHGLEARGTNAVRRSPLPYDSSMISDERSAGRRWFVLFSSVFSFFAIGATFFVVPPLVPQLIERFGLSNFQIGILMGSISLPAVFLAVVVGMAVDRWPPLRIGIIFFSLMIAGATTFALAPTFPTLVAGRLVFGIGGLVINLLLARVLTAVFAERELALAMGVFMATYPASMITVFSLHPLLLDRLGWRNELILLAALVAIALPLFAISVRGIPAARDEPSDDPVVSTRVPWRLVGLAMIWMLFFAVHATVLTFAPSWAGGGSRGLLTVTAVMWIAMVGSPIVGWTIDGAGRPGPWVSAGLLIQGATLVGMATGVIGPFPAMLGIGMAAALVPTAVYASPAHLVEPRRVGFAFGFMTAFSNLGTITGPALSGRLLDLTSRWNGVWWALALAAGLAFIVSWVVRRPDPPRP